MTPPDSFKKHGRDIGIGRQGEHPYGDLGQIIILLGFLAIWILDSFIFRYSTFLSPYVPIYVRLIFEGLILILALYLVRSGHRAISDEVFSSPCLLTDGAFSHVRHPIYLAALLFYVFLIGLTLSLISVFVFTGIVVFYNCIATYEEKFLEQKFGQKYRDYRKNVPKWIPRLNLRLCAKNR
jgi:protein-S-isoprenylcysteine O-methyltransferase Ste14